MCVFRERERGVERELVRVLRERESRGLASSGSKLSDFERKNSQKQTDREASWKSASAVTGTSSRSA